MGKGRTKADRETSNIAVTWSSHGVGGFGWVWLSLFCAKDIGAPRLHCPGNSKNILSACWTADRPPVA